MLAWRTCVAVALFCAGLLAGCGGTQTDVIEPPQPGANLALKLANLQAVTGAPGLVAIVREADGQEYRAAVGTADLATGEPITLNHRFFTGSCAKMFVAVIMLQLEEEGRLDLDDPLSDYLDWPRGGDITLRMLLNHTSGIPDYINEVMFYYSGQALVDAYSRDWTPAQCLELVRNLQLHFEPGSSFAYSNSNFLLLAQIIELADGVNLAQAIDTRICQPLGLEHTYLYLGGDAPDFPVPGYSNKGWFRLWDQESYGGLHETVFLDRHFLGTPDTSLVSTAGDLLLFHRGLRRGLLVNVSSLEQMELWLGGGTYGLGYTLFDSTAGWFEGHQGKTLGHSTLCAYHSATGAYVVVLANLSRADLGDVLDWGFAQ